MYARRVLLFIYKHIVGSVLARRGDSLVLVILFYGHLVLIQIACGTDLTLIRTAVASNACSQQLLYINLLFKTLAAAIYNHRNIKK